MSPARQIPASALVGAVVWSSWASTMDHFTWDLVWLGVGLGAAVQVWFELRNRESPLITRISRVVGAATAAVVLGVVLVFAVAAVQIALDTDTTWG